jgi:membrane associated rhomboid family serine protease
LNGIDEKTCYRCGKRLPGPISSSLLGTLTDFSADGLAATKLFAGACIVLYVVGMLSDGGLKLSFSLVGGFSMSTMLRFGMLFGDLAYSEPWRLLAAVFLHFGLIHIGVNMLSLANLGRTLEPHFGSARFVIIYVVTGILGFVVSQWWYGFSPPTAGASGAIFGLVGAFVGVLFARRHPNWTRVLVNNLIFAAIIGLAMPANTAAHLGGFVAGMVIGALFERERQPRRHDGFMRAVAGLCLLGCVASIVLSTRSPVWKEVRRQEAERRHPNSE